MPFRKNVPMADGSRKPNCGPAPSATAGAQTAAPPKVQDQDLKPTPAEEVPTSPEKTSEPETKTTEAPEAPEPKE